VARKQSDRAGLDLLVSRNFYSLAAQSFWRARLPGIGHGDRGLLQARWNGGRCAKPIM